MKVNEFQIFVHGPFASNIHLDARQLENLKIVISQRPLGIIEFHILKSLEKYRKTKEQLFKELTQQMGMLMLSDVFVAIKNLEASGFIYKKQQSPNAPILKTIEANRVVKGGVVVTTKILKRPIEQTDTAIFSKYLFSITQEGNEKLVDSLNNRDYYREIGQYFGVNIDNELTHTSLDKFWKEISAYTNINNYHILDQPETKPETESYFFGEEDRPVLLAKFRLPNFPDRSLIQFLQIMLRYF